MNATSRGSSSSMNTLIVAPRRVHRSTSASVAAIVSRVGGQAKSANPSRGEVRGRLAVGDHQDDRLGVAVLVEVPPGEHQPVLQVGALHAVPVVVDQRAGRHHAGVVAEADDLDRVLRVLGA